jgi:TP901 family phage tail tape measure protein
MFSAEFLARFSAVLTGKNQVVSGLEQLNAAANKQIQTGQKVNTMYDTQGNVTGKQITDTFKLNQATKQSSTYFGELERALNRVAVVVPIWMLARTVITGTLNAINKAGKFLVEMEDAMARIQIVGKGTQEEIKGLQQGLIGLAFAYGTSASEALNAAKIFAQQGRTVNETYQLTRAAMIGAKILGVSIADSVNNLTAAVEGFQIPINNAISIVDKWIAVEKEFAVTSQDLAEATKVSAASANQLGITMSEFLGEVTAVVEVTRKTGSEAARGLSFIYARLLTSAKPVIEQITKIPLYLDAQGDATSAVTSHTRRLSDILGDLAGKWNTLTVEEKLQLATSLGSKRQMTIVNALMQNYSRALDATIVSLTSAGQAEKAFAILQTTSIYKSQQLTAAFNTLTGAVADTSAWKGFLDILTKITIGWSGIINQEKGLRAVVAQQTAGILATIEARKSEVASLEDLLVIRDKLIKAPSTEKNEERLKTVQTAIEKLSATNPNIKIALDKGNTEELKNQIQKTTDELETQRITATVQIDFFPKITDLEDKKKKLANDIANFTNLYGGNSTEVVNFKKQLIPIEKELAELNTKQQQEIEKQVVLTKTQRIQKDLILEADEEDETLSTALTDKEKEKMNIQLKLNIAKMSGILSSSQMLNLEAELVRTSQFSYNAHEKTLKLAELETAKREEAVSIANTLMNHELELMKIRGLSGVALVQTEIALKGALYGESAVKNSLESRLDLEKAITQEKENQNTATSEEVALMKIAKKFGTGTAQDIASFLAGQTSLTGLGGTDIKALKKFMPGNLESAQAAEFFRTTGISRPADLRNQRAVQQINDIKNIDARIGNINVDVDLESIVDQIKEAVSKELDNGFSDMTKKIKGQIENF